MIIYTKHSKLRLRQRKLKESEINETILNPEKIITSFGKRKLARKEFSGKVLEVVFIQDNSDFIVLTAYWLKEEK